MSNELQQLIEEVARETSGKLPDVLDQDAPVLESSPQDFYFIGIIGGKDVGKTALVNALAGRTLSEPIGYGAGTDKVIAYAHESVATKVREVLHRDTGGAFEIVTHNSSELRRQVLLDLPDVDSRYESHVELTRRLLKRMLFPVWVASVEKYADERVQKLLASVAMGNDPGNFLFVMNKADQVSGKSDEVPARRERSDEGEPELAQLRDDYAERVRKVLAMGAAPRVYVVSAIRPEAFDLPELRTKLAREKGAGEVKQSLELAHKRRARTMLDWLREQRLGERAAALARLQGEAEEAISSRIGEALLESAVPAMMDDPNHRAAMVDEVMNARVSRWPIVNIVHALLGPLVAAYRANASAVAAPTAENLVGRYLQSNDRPLSNLIQSTFALLHRSEPAIADLYRGRKLWEDLASENAQNDLRRRLAGAIERQRAAAMQKLAGGGFGAPIRWLLTIGAILWFPFVQPLLEIALKDGIATIMKDTAVLIVQILGAAYLLKSVSFLLIWFLFLWAALRWDTARRVNRLLARWRRVGAPGEETNLATATLAWMDELVDPIRNARDRAEDLNNRARTLAA